ncbi:serine/threonine-protein kinase, partial [Acidobacteria bacterium AH-259-D05]|nr:serine/threonine-protein kinase [Acidobacteria bacterium AH-259-D05]
EKGALPLEQTLEYAIQIADALDKAHRQGVVHRDLKPGNIMLVKSGAKLLDFGLAKLRATEATQENLSTLPTEQANLTAEGTILGTLQYMAPEQLEGKDTDSRTDIFAFGAVVYEMATGRKAFEGKSQASLIAAIMGQEPRPMSELQPMTPQLLDEVVKKCLAKEPNERWQTASDLMTGLRWVTEVGAQAGLSPSVAAPPLWRRAIPWSIMVLAVAVVAGAIWSLTQPVSRPITRFLITPGPTAPLANISSNDLAISPDGSSTVYLSASGAGRQLYLRRRDEITAMPIPGTEGSFGDMFFSPDGRSVAFFTIDQLKRVSLLGGERFRFATQPLAE